MWDSWARTSAGMVHISYQLEGDTYLAVITKTDNKDGSQESKRFRKSDLEALLNDIKTETGSSKLAALSVQKFVSTMQIGIRERSLHIRGVRPVLKKLKEGIKPEKTVDPEHAAKVAAARSERMKKMRLGKKKKKVVA